MVREGRLSPRSWVRWCVFLLWDDNYLSPDQGKGLGSPLLNPQIFDDTRCAGAVEHAALDALAATAHLYGNRPQALHAAN